MGQQLWGPALEAEVAYRREYLERADDRSSQAGGTSYPGLRGRVSRRR
jgi:hypothetical protein